MLMSAISTVATVACLRFSACFMALRLLLQDLEQVVTSSHTFSHFFLHVNGPSSPCEPRVIASFGDHLRWHTTQTFSGKFSFLTPLMASRVVVWKLLFKIGLLKYAEQWYSSMKQTHSIG